MSETVFIRTVFVASFLLMAACIGGILYGCQQAGRRYVALADRCVQSGGTWVPTGLMAINGACVAMHSPVAGARP